MSQDHDFSPRFTPESRGAPLTSCCGRCRARARRTRLRECWLCLVCSALCRSAVRKASTGRVLRILGSCHYLKWNEPGYGCGTRRERHAWAVGSLCGAVMNVVKMSIMQETALPSGPAWPSWSLGPTVPDTSHIRVAEDTQLVC